FSTTSAPRPAANSATKPTVAASPTAGAPNSNASPTIAGVGITSIASGPRHIPPSRTLTPAPPFSTRSASVARPRRSPSPACTPPWTATAPAGKHFSGDSPAAFLNLPSFLRLLRLFAAIPAPSHHFAEDRLRPLIHCQKHPPDILADQTQQHELRP